MIVNKLIDFINNSPTCFNAIKNIEQDLIEKGFVLLDEKEKFSIIKGNSYYVKRNDSSLIAFTVGNKIDESYAFNTPFSSTVFLSPK